MDCICQGTGGPCIYIGMEMKAAHRGMHINASEFDALAEDLVKSLDKFKVPEREKTELLALLSPMKADIIDR